MSFNIDIRNIVINQVLITQDNNCQMCNSRKKMQSKYINQIYLKGKMILVITLIIVGIISVPIISWPGDKFKFVKHALEWDYFLGVIIFYLLTFFMWKNKKK